MFFFWKYAANLLKFDCVNQKYYTIFHWFTNHLLYIDHGITKFSYINTTEMRKSSLRKTSRWNARLIYTINKNNNKNNNKNQARITKAFEKFLVSETILSIITKIFLLCTLNDIASFNFFEICWFEQSISCLKFKLSASKGCCFCFLLLSTASCYWIDKGRNFCQQMPGFLYSICIWKYVTKINYEERAYDHFHLRLAHIFSGKFCELIA